MNLNKEMLDGLIADAIAGNCTIELSVTSQGATLVLRKGTVVTGTTDLSRTTILSRWLDKNDPELNHKVTKAFHSLP